MYYYYYICIIFGLNLKIIPGVIQTCLSCRCVHLALRRPGVMSVGTSGGEQPRSIQSELFSFVRFINRTQQTVDLFWINYAGDREKYTTLQPGCQFGVDTFATHPWIFRDAISGNPLRVEGQEVFYPQPWDPGHSRQWKDVFIDLSGILVHIAVKK